MDTNKPESKQTDKLKPGFEAVFTITDYHDGPRKGIANYHGQPHFYECIFDDAKDDYSELFWLTPLDAKTFQLAMEDWDIWRRWESAFHSGKTDRSTHPALPNEADRHSELKRILDGYLATDPDKGITRVGRFEVLGETGGSMGVTRKLQVEWAEHRLESPSKSHVR